MTIEETQVATNEDATLQHLLAILRDQQPWKTVTKATHIPLPSAVIHLLLTDLIYYVSINSEMNLLSQTKIALFLEDKNCFASIIKISCP